MKRFILPALLLSGLLQILPLAGASASRTTSAKKRASAKKKSSHKKLPVSPKVDPTVGDNIDGDDLTIRRAAVDALGAQNGSIVVVEPGTGRVLTMVNQKLGLRSGFIPCSTIKLVTALAALSEHIVDRDTFIHLGRYTSYNLTTALARSNNPYFAELGKRLGFDRVVRYAQMLGLGETAGLDIPGEQPGSIAAEPPKWGGVGLMTSFGEGFQMTPLELAGLLSAVANGGTLYYLQYPRTQADIETFSPKIKRTLELAPNGISDIRMGMRGAVDFGTARRAAYDSNEPILGKTGTCTDFSSSSHMGWFGSFNDVGTHQLVVVVMLAAINKSVSGPIAAGVAGAVYHTLSEQHYFSADGSEANVSMPQIISTKPCCDR
jgi:cell division protein FtsI/penicillin-binding protein 2